MPFIDLLLSQPEGRIIACNALESLNKGLISKKCWRRFFLECLRVYNEHKDSVDIRDLIGLFKDIANKKKFFLLAPTHSIDHTVYNVIDINKLISRLEKEFVLWEGEEECISTPVDPSDETISYMVTDLNYQFNKYKLQCKLVDPNWPIFWITSSEINGNADKVRDALGLIHYGNNSFLVRIEIPPTSIKESSRPTFIDGLSSRSTRFRVRPDTSPVERDTTWGYTVNLESFANGCENIDGVPERVVQAIDEDSPLKFDYIGRTSSIPGNDDIRFANRVCRGIDIKDLRKKILEKLL